MLLNTVPQLIQKGLSIESIAETYQITVEKVIEVLEQEKNCNL
jgi:uncharacterized protein (DUF433 family)